MCNDEHELVHMIRTIFSIGRIHNKSVVPVLEVEVKLNIVVKMFWKRVLVSYLFLKLEFLNLLIL